MLGDEPLHAGRGGLELEANGLGQLAAGLRCRARGDFDHIGGRHRQAVEHLRVVLEAESASADPLPAPRQRRRDRGRNVEFVELADGGEGHHRLVEGDADEGSDPHLALRLHPQHGQWSGIEVRCVDVRPGRKRPLNGLTGAGRRQRLGRPVEVDSVAVVVVVPWRKPVGHGTDLRSIERPAVHPAHRGRAQTADRIALAKANGQCCSLRRTAQTAGRSRDSERGSAAGPAAITARTRCRHAAGPAAIAARSRRRSAAGPAAITCVRVAVAPAGTGQQPNNDSDDQATPQMFRHRSATLLCAVTRL